MGRPRPDMRISVISTRSEVEVKVTGLLKFRKLQFPTSISSAILVWSSKLMVGSDIINYSTWSKACLSTIFKFPSRKAIT